MRSVAFGRDEAIAHLELSEAHVGDLDVYALHPAILDMATGFAFTLFEGANADSSLFVPLSYGRLRTTQQLPRRVISHVRRRPGSGEGVGVLDATLADEQGHVVLEIEGYVVKAVDHKVLRGARRSDSPPTPLERWVEHGILPDEGFDLLGRVIAEQTEVQVLVSPLDLHAMIAELGAPEKPAPAAVASVDATASGAGDASQAGRPRDEIEQKLAGFWSELLGVATVRLQDNFFDLGGHSLIAVRLFARIRKTWGVDLPLATLFSASTLETLSAEVRERLGLTLDLPAASSASSAPSAAAAAPTPARNGWTPLVPIRKGGSQAPLLLRARSGRKPPQLPRLRPRDSIRSNPSTGSKPAASTASCRRRSQSRRWRTYTSKPFVACRATDRMSWAATRAGGVVALEIARRLTAAGERTARVVLLDTFHPSTVARGLGWRERVDGFVGGFAASGFGFLRRVASAVVTRHVTWARQDKRLRECLSRGEPVPHELREWYITTSFVEVLRRHTPAPYSGKVTLFRAQEVAQVYEHMGPRLGWTSTELPDLDVVEVPGGHDSLVREPNVRILAEGLENLLRRGSEEGLSKGKVTVGV